MSASNPLTAEQRSQRASIAALSRWATVADRGAALKPAKEGFLARFERQVDPDGVLDPRTRAVRAQAARSAHMRALALKSSRKRGAAVAARKQQASST